MTNTRITDPEVLETRYPVRLERFEIRRDSGGRGQSAAPLRKRITAPLPILSSERREIL